ncbi:MAG: hypothetical protein QGG40_05470, partial [Myxococcota bacterium]|nr:hypothetical protein [Myxococcota bacterium]
MSTMPARAPVVVLAVLVAAGCSDQKVTVYNNPPAASILSPVDGDIITEGELVELVGVVKDSQDDEEDLEISWSSNVDGVLGTDAADAEGSVYLAVADLTAGAQVVTLTVADTDGESDSTAVSFTIGDDGTIDDEGSPTVMLVGPSDGEEIIENT